MSEIVDNVLPWLLIDDKHKKCGTTCPNPKGKSHYDDCHLPFHKNWMQNMKSNLSCCSREYLPLLHQIRRQETSLNIAVIMFDCSCIHGAYWIIYWQVFFWYGGSSSQSHDINDYSMMVNKRDRLLVLLLTQRQISMFENHQTLRAPWARFVSSAWMNWGGNIQQDWVRWTEAWKSQGTAGEEFRDVLWQKKH